MTSNLKSRLNTILLGTVLFGAVSASAATVQVTANLTGTTTWRNTNEYVLNGFIYALKPVLNSLLI